MYNAFDWIHLQASSYNQDSWIEHARLFQQQIQELDGSKFLRSLDCWSITIYKSSCTCIYTSVVLQFINHLLAPQTVDMASHILLVIASFLAIICALPTASDLSPLQDSCVADPTSSGCMFYDDCSKN
jgi:hypothetical protein